MGRRGRVVWGALVMFGCGPELAHVEADGTTSAGGSSTGPGPVDASTSGAGEASSGGGSTGAGGGCELDCGVFASACVALGLADCQPAATCAVDPCSACGQTLGACASAEVVCPEVVVACAALRSGCDCDACEPVGEQTPDERLAICLEFPWPLGDSCGAHDAGQCFAALGQASCRISTCEYRGCVTAAAATACGQPPAACDVVAACSE